MTHATRSTNAISHIQRSRAPALRQGHEGEHVRTVQQSLRTLGFPIAVDGDYGPKTARAVRDFQRAQGLTTDGKAGPETLTRMRDVLAGHGRDQVDPAAGRGGVAPRAPRTPQTHTHTPGGQLRRGLSSPAGTAVAGAERAAGTPTGAGATAAPRARAGAPANQTATFDRVGRNAGLRNQMVEGRLTINGNTYNFRSGGHGRGNLPKGDYKITRHLDYRKDASMNVGGEGYSFAMSDKYDPRVKGTRTLLRIHPDGRGPGTEGCVGIVGDAATQRRFRADMLAELRRNGGSFTLSIR